MWLYILVYSLIYYEYRIHEYTHSTVLENAFYDELSKWFEIFWVDSV